jgi:hypothetical protein
VSAPFDTLKLARQFEAAGFEPKQAGDMAAAIAEAQASADLATKADLQRLELATKGSIERLERDLKIWTGSVGAALLILLFGALHLWPPH